MTMSPYSHQLGIDLAKDKFDVCLLNSDQSLHATFANSPAGFLQLLEWLTRQKALTAHACMEATGRHGQALAQFLHEKDIAVSVVNALAIYYFARSQMSRNKTDRHDALLIAHYARHYHPRLWQPRTRDLRQLQAWVRLREQLIQSRVMAQQRCKESPPEIIPFFTRQITLLKKQIQQVDGKIRQLSQAPGEVGAALKLLQSIPGLGLTTAATVLAAMPDITQLESARQLAAFAGVTPRQSQSGRSAGKTRLSKLGHGRLRKALYFPAVCALKYNPRVKAMAQRMGQKGKAKMVIIGAAMRQLLHLCYGVLKTRTPFNPEYLKRTTAN